MSRRPRLTFLLNAGSTKEGELNRETPAGFMQNLGLAVLSRDGWLAFGNGLSCHLFAGQFRVQSRPAPSLTQRVVAEVVRDSMSRRLASSARRAA